MQFNWKPSAPKETLEERLDKHAALVGARINDMTVKWERDRADLWKALNDLTDAANKAKTPDITELEKRMAVLETWRAQLHGLLVEKGNTGKEKLSRSGHFASKRYGRD